MEKSQYENSIVVVHVVPNHESLDSITVNDKVLRLREYLDSLLENFSSNEYVFKILSIKGMDLTHLLPVYLKDRIEVYYEEESQPMFLEYHGYDVFLQFAKQYDYFSFW